MKILLIDNYDSFTYNLVHYFEGFHCDVTVVRNDELKLGAYQDYDKIVLSPGPGLPSESGQLMDALKHFLGKKPIMGVCLGFQAIIEEMGGEIYNQQEVKHGVAENCLFSPASKLFRGLPANFKIGLYHSWAANPSAFPKNLIVTATSDNKVVMAFEHKELPICGVQFHPESILTENGKQIIQNFLTHF